MNHLKTWWYHPVVQWIVRTFYYTAILLGLIIIYGFAAAHTGSFIYNEF
ncbi:teichoic acid D-Ala incorporation-associated protein DltX [Sporolactobacillus shoreae]|uniref:Teichoic acid D-Ala incorporation-associated protein DltX n=1 Tax=Sporolactobacillus shoreae TaxID=1465501 RepID=A0A4Z0GRI9_9BACL|nr:teichoic acid D-Ala incorporation-associated protein DltX [Sporolactobacillus shoreae]TGA98845.1 teichoic acid D-Ala incorporation-associated protein DltX [Sporolactobacillus shoreae]